MNIVNKTPHPVHIVNEAGLNIHTFEKAAEPIRLLSERDERSSIGHIPTSFTKMLGGALPTFKEDVFSIVSLVVQLAFRKREDLLSPSELVRDETGRIVGCKSLGRNR